MFRNNETSFGWIAIAFHWLMAVAILFMFGLGLYMVDLSYYDTWYKGSLDLHKSIGIVLLILWIGRLTWRQLNASPKPLSSNSWYEHLEQKLAHWVHVILYMLMLLLMLSGYLISTADGRSIDVFGLFEVPAIPELIDKQEDIAGEIHFYLAWLLIITVSMHGMAALKHHFIDKDKTLSRMLKPQTAKS